MIHYVCNKCECTNVHYDFNYKEIYCDDCMDVTTIKRVYYDEETGITTQVLVTSVTVTTPTHDSNKSFL